MSILTTPAVVSKRLQFCTSCEFKKVVFMIPRCEQCGCMIAGKVRIANQNCPINKWVAEDTSKQGAN